jgi:hypothetical protein
MPQSVTAPLPESWNTPEGWARWLAIVNEELSLRGLPPLAAKPAPRESEPGPCPPWCTCKDEHPDEPYHIGRYRALDLSLAELYPVADLAPDLYARLERGFRADETVIDVVVKDRYDIELTLAEAGDLAEILTALIREAGTA